MRKQRYLAALVGLMVLTVSLGVVACGDDGGDGNGGTPTSSTGSVSTTASPTTTVAGPPVMTVQDALKAESGTVARVVGALIVTYGEAAETEPTMILTTAVGESYPPVAAGPSMPVKDLDLEQLVGLSSTEGQPDVALATWSDYWVVLQGTIVDGMLEVTALPSIIQAITPELRLRFSVVSEPVDSGDVEWFAFDLRNEAATTVDLTFSSGQQAEVVLSQDGVEKYRWSEGTLFTESIETVTLEPQQTFHVILNDSVDVAPGSYDVTAYLTATATSGGKEIQLPALEGPLHVRD